MVGGLLAALVVINLAMALKIGTMELGQQLIVQQGQTSVTSLLKSALVHRLTYGFGLLTIVTLLVIGLAFLIGRMQKNDPEEEQQEQGRSGSCS